MKITIIPFYEKRSVPFSSLQPTKQNETDSSVNATKQHEIPAFHWDSPRNDYNFHGKRI